MSPIDVDAVVGSRSDKLERLAYSPGETAQVLGITRQHVYNLIRSGVLPTVHLGRSCRIPATALSAILEGGDAGAPTS